MTADMSSDTSGRPFDGDDSGVKRDLTYKGGVYPALQPGDVLDINSRYPEVMVVGGRRAGRTRRTKRARKSVEALEFMGAVRRFLRAAGERVADSDEPELRALLALQIDLDEAIAVAVRGQRSVGRSWAYIATATGTTRQAAQQRWAGK